MISNDNYLIATGTTLSPTGFADFALAKYHLIDGLGIGGNTINKKVLFYPNPVQNVLYMSPEVETVNLFSFDGKEIIGVYDKTDLGFEKNLVSKINNPEVTKGKMLAKAWYQDYMDRVINRKLN